MPIYAYRCDACGHRQDVLQKMSDPTLTVCPACSAESFARQLSAPAFQLKGTGWYVTDFRDNGKKPGNAGKSANGNGSAAGTSDGASDSKPESKPDGQAGGAASESATPAVAPASTAAKAGAGAAASAGASSAG